MENKLRQTYPNQRMVNIHREAPKYNFLGIQNANWQDASKDLGAHALMLYLYLASNKDNYQLALSPAAVQDAIGMPRSTYHDQFHKLESRGYIVNSHGNTYEFYERPRVGQTHANDQNGVSAAGLALENDPVPNSRCSSAGAKDPPEEIEINNINNVINNNINRKNIGEEFVF